MRPPGLFDTDLPLRDPLPTQSRSWARNTMSVLLATCALTLGTWLGLDAALDAPAHAGTQSVNTSCDRSGTTITWQATAAIDNGDSGTLTGALQQRVSGAWVTQDSGTDSTHPFAISGRGRSNLLGPHRVVAQFTNHSAGTIHTVTAYCY